MTRKPGDLPAARARIAFAERGYVERPSCTHAPAAGRVFCCVACCPRTHFLDGEVVPVPRFALRYRRLLAALLLVAVGLLVPPPGPADAGDPFGPFGGRAAYVAAQQQRYRDALARGDEDLVRRLLADARRVGYPLFPLTITDDAGRRVTVQRPPQRIVSLAPSNTEILFAIGAGPLVVGVDSFSDHPAQVRDLPRVGGYLDTNYEKIVELRPDLILTIAGSQQVPRLEELGLTVVVVQPQTLDDVLDRVLLVGQLTGHVDGARRVVAEMRRAIETVGRAVAGAPARRRPRVFYEVWHDPPMTVGPGGFIHDVIVRAGGVNVFADARQAWPQVSLEELVRRDPQVIITTSRESYDQLRARRRPGWEGITAVRRGAILLLDPGIIARPGPRLVQGLEQIARYLYPDRVR